MAITVTGTVLDPFTSDPLSGSGVIRPETWWTFYDDPTDGQTRVEESYFDLDVNGEFSVDVMATDDSLLYEPGFQYILDLNNSSYSFALITFSAPTAGGAVDLTTDIEAAIAPAHPGQAPHAMVNGSFALWPVVDGLNTAAEISLGFDGLWLSPMSNPTPFTFAEVGIEVVTTGTDPVRLGAFLLDPVAGVFDLLHDFGTVDISTTGWKIASGGPWTLPAGIVWLGGALQGTDDAFGIRSPGAWVQPGVSPHFTTATSIGGGGYTLGPIKCGAVGGTGNTPGAFPAQATPSAKSYTGPPIFHFGRITLEA
jgi:hypothetical protein